MILDVVIFSKDRACQLDALLRSIDINFKLPCSSVSVLYKSSNDMFERGYSILKRNLKKETDFYHDTMTILKSGSAPYIVFFVDDDVVTHPVEKDSVSSRFVRDDNILTLSLRMGRNITHSQILGKDVTAPLFPGHMCVWSWEEQDDSWNYPMSLDGHIYRRNDIVPYIQKLSFETPNRLEALMAENPLTKSLMICPQQSKVVGLCLNRVQDVYQNRCGNITAEELNTRWVEGERINLTPIFGKTFNSLHVIPLIEYEKR